MVGHGLSDPESDRSGPVLPSVVSDPQRMGERATHHLFSQGYERIGFFSSWTPRGMFAARWLDGYHLAHHHARKPIDPELIFAREDHTSHGEEAAEHFLSLSIPPVAYVVPDALAASSLSDALQDREHPIAANAMVLCSSKEYAERFRLTDYPRFTDDFPSLAAEDLSLLTADQWSARPTQLIVSGLSTGLE
jgi:DNA-binding LacI/PurR family transcriptional regulator